MTWRYMTKKEKTSYVAGWIAIGAFLVADVGFFVVLIDVILHM